MRTVWARWRQKWQEEPVGEFSRAEVLGDVRPAADVQLVRNDGAGAGWSGGAPCGGNMRCYGGRLSEQRRQEELELGSEVEQKEQRLG
jgi:hypothetical protein